MIDTNITFQNFSLVNEALNRASNSMDARAFYDYIFSTWHPYKNGFEGGFDMRYKGTKIDVKQKGRPEAMKPYFVHNFIGFQKEFDCDFYIFNSLNKTTNKLEICGWITKDNLIKKSCFYKEGDVRNRDNGTCFEMKADTYEIENRLLNKINLLL